MSRHAYWHPLLAIILLPHVAPASLSYGRPYDDQPLLLAHAQGGAQMTHRDVRGFAVVYLRLRLRGGMGRKYSICSMPRAKSMKQIAPAWAAEFGGKTIDINGTSYYHYEFRENKKDEVRVAVEKLKAQLRKYGGVKELIAECGDDPSKLERYLDEARLVLDWWRQEGRLPAWVDEATPELREHKELARRQREAGKAKKRQRLETTVAEQLQGRASAWFDQDPESGAKSCVQAPRDKRAVARRRRQVKKRKADSTAGKGGDGRKMDRARRGVRPGSAGIPSRTPGHHNDTISRLRGGRGADVPGVVKREPHVVQTGLQPFDEEGLLSSLCERAQHLFESDQDYDVAEALYKRVLAIDPNHVDTLCNYALLLEMTQDEDAEEDVAAGELDRADEMYSRAVDLSPHRPDVLYQRALFLKNVRADYDGAEELFKRVLTLEPRDATALCNYGLLLQHVRNDAAGAQDLYKRALALPPDTLSDEEHVSLRYSYGSFCQDVLHDVRQAQLHFEAALILAPEDCTVLNKMAALQHLYCNNTGAAQSMYQQVLSLDPANVEALSNCGLLFQHLKRSREAYSLFKRALREAPDDADALCNMAQFEHKKRRRFSRSRALYRKALKIDRRHLRSLVNFGVLEGKHFENVSKARRLFSRALDIDPACVDAREGFIQCQSLESKALIQDAEDPDFERFVYRPTNMAGPA